MAGSLIKVDEFTISSPVASVILGGGSSGSSGLNASIDSTYDVYMVKVNNVVPETDSTQLYIRFTASGTPDTSANYDYAYKQLRADSAFNNNSLTNQTVFIEMVLGTAGNESANATYYLFNFNNASEYSFYTGESVVRTNLGYLRGHQGGGVHTVAEANDGINFFFSSSGNIASGTFTLYGLKK
jgi:hypothetical protein